MQQALQGPRLHRVVAQATYLTDALRPSGGRHLNFFQHHCYVTAPVPRTDCPEHGIKTVTVPWARKGSAFTMFFEAMVMLLARKRHLNAAATVDWFHITALVSKPWMRCAWRRVSASRFRIGAPLGKVLDPFTKQLAPPDPNPHETARNRASYPTFAAFRVHSLLCRAPGAKSAAPCLSHSNLPTSSCACRPMA